MNLELQKEKQELEKDFKKTKNQIRKEMEDTWNQKIQQLNDIIEKQRQNNSQQHKCTKNKCTTVR